MTMNLDRFEQIVSAYGAEHRRWPDAERDAALAFASENAAQAAPLLAEARALDADLDTADEIRVSDLLATRILARAPKRMRQPFEPGNSVRPALALAACAMFGVFLGIGGGALAPVSTQTDAGEAMIASAFQDDAVDFEALGVEG